MSSDIIRLSGMNSGLDTESLVQALVSAKSTKVETAKLDQKELTWKQDAWKSLNTKVNSFFNGTLSKMKYSDVYLQKKTTASDETVATAITGSAAANGTQKLYVDSLAQTAFLTGAKMQQTYTGTTKLSETEDSTGTLATGTLSLTINGTTEELSLGADATINDLVDALKEKGLNANFDEVNQRLFVSSKSTGAANDFTITGTDNMLQALGLDATLADATKIDAADASIRLNGVTFTSDKNTFEINGLTITAKKVSTEEIALTTADDTDGIYDMIKDFVEGYSALMVEMDTLYGADSADDYDMLTDDQREEMSEEEIEEWDQKIKGALLRNDGTLNSFSTIMTSVVSSSIEIDGENKYLSDFGIGTLSYFEAEDFHRNELHIDGNLDDDVVAGNTDLLRAAISSDPEGVTAFFTEFTRSLYSSMNDAMSRTELSSMFTVYNDIKMQNEYDDYTSKIAEYEEELHDYEERYYERFTAMEVALSKLESSSSAVTSLLGS